MCAVVEWLSSQKMDTATRDQILDETVCNQHGINTLGKCRIQFFLPTVKGK